MFINLKILFASFLISFSLNSFSQKKPKLLIYEKSKVCDGHILGCDNKNCQLLNRKGHVLYNFPGNIIEFNQKKILSHIAGKLLSYDKDMDILWTNSCSVHHELIVTPENNIMLLSEDYDSINHAWVRFDKILCLDSAGKQLFQWSTLDQRRYLMEFMMKDKNIFRYKITGSSDPDSVLNHIAQHLRIRGVAPEPFYRELFHMNSIQVIPENETEKRDTIFRKGNLLLSFCNYNDSLTSFIAVIEPVHFNILWHYVQKDRRMIHTPSMLPNGHILMYVNSCYRYKDSSFVEEIDPITKTTVWYYTEQFPEVEKRSINGSCQRLPNGNTLISNTNGNIYEVTPDKIIVWHMSVNEKKILYRAYLYPKEKFKWLVNEE